MRLMRLSYSKEESFNVFKELLSKIIFAIIILIAFNLVFPMPWFTKTSRIGTFSSGPGVSISPNKIPDNANVLPFDTTRNEILQIEYVPGTTVRQLLT